MKLPKRGSEAAGHGPQGGAVSRRCSGEVKPQLPATTSGGCMSGAAESTRGSLGSSTETLVSERRDSGRVGVRHRALWIIKDLCPSQWFLESSNNVNYH